VQKLNQSHRAPRIVYLPYENPHSRKLMTPELFELAACWSLRGGCLPLRSFIVPGRGPSAARNSESAASRGDWEGLARRSCYNIKGVMSFLDPSRC
jgi:hypothetical protein